MCRFYVYRHIRKDKNVPFYIGVGTKSTTYASYETEFRRAFTFKRRKKIWNDISRKAEIEVEIICEFEKYEDALAKERELISLYGRINIRTGTLANLTEGGEGTIGYKYPKEILDKIYSKRIGRGNSRSKTCYQYNLEGRLVKIHESFNSAAKELGIMKQNVLLAKKIGRQSGGYFWSEKEYKNFLIKE